MEGGMVDILKEGCWRWNWEGGKQEDLTEVHGCNEGGYVEVARGTVKEDVRCTHPLSSLQQHGIYFLCCKRPSHRTSIVLGNNVSVALLHSPASALILQSALSKEITPLFQLRLLGNHCTTVLPPRLHAISFLITLVADCARFLNVITKCVLVKHCESWIMHPTFCEHCKQRGTRSLKPSTHY